MHCKLCIFSKNKYYKASLRQLCNIERVAIGCDTQIDKQDEDPIYLFIYYRQNWSEWFMVNFVSEENNHFTTISMIPFMRHCDLTFFSLYHHHISSSVHLHMLVTFTLSPFFLCNYNG